MANATLISQESALVGQIVNAELTTTGLSVQVDFTDSKTGAARTPQSTTLDFVIDKDNSRFEKIRATSHTTAGSTTTLTIDAAGRAIPLFGIGAGGATGTRHPIGAQIGCVYTHEQVEQLNNVMDGTSNTSGTVFRIGANTDVDIDIVAGNSDANEPFIRYDASENQWIFSNDGTSTTDVGGGTGSITAGDGIVITAGSVAVDLAATPGLEFTGGQLQVLVVATGGVDIGATGLVLDLTEAGYTAGPIATVISDVTATAAEINTPLDGASANVTAANLSTLTAGSSSIADALHTHANSAVSFTAIEAVTADDAVGLMPLEVEFFTQLTDANLALGDSNTRRRYAVEFTPIVTSSTLTTMLFRAAEAVNGATTLGNLTISIQPDSSGDPSGTAIANGTANVITQATQRTWNTTQANRTATWAAAPTLTAGTTYWLVVEVAATDNTNFLNISVNSSHNEDFVTFTRSTYDLDTDTWGNDVTNATPFFWFDAQVKLLGVGVVTCDANFGGRTWNFIGFARTTVAINTSVDVYYNVVPDLSSLTPGATYYLSATAGAITTTPPFAAYFNGTEPSQFMYKIGRAVTTTDFKIELGDKRVQIEENDMTDTTTREYIVWFRPKNARIFAVGGAAGVGTSIGFLNATNGDTGLYFSDSGAAVQVGQTPDSLRAGFSDQFNGAGSNISDVGFTYVYTETNAAGLSVIIECEG